MLFQKGILIFFCLSLFLPAWNVPGFKSSRLAETLAPASQKIQYEDLQFFGLSRKGDWSVDYMVVNKRTGKVYTLKVFAPNFVPVQKHFDLFEYEAEMYRQGLPHIPKGYELFYAAIPDVPERGSRLDVVGLSLKGHTIPLSEARPCLLMEHVDGVSFKEILQKDIQSFRELYLNVIALYRAARGMDRLHSKGFFHGNVKPENILYDPYQKRLYYVSLQFSEYPLVEQTVEVDPDYDFLWGTSLPEEEKDKKRVEANYLKSILFSLTQKIDLESGEKNNPKIGEAIQRLKMLSRGKILSERARIQDPYDQYADAKELSEALYSWLLNYSGVIPDLDYNLLRYPGETSI